MNVAIYLRKSREEDNETREETLARHERILLDYCNNNDLIIKQIYKEVVSGESIANRPQMQLLLDDVKNNLYDGVVCVELERLSRGNQIDQAEILEIFKKTKTKIYTLNKIFDLSSEDELDEEFFEFGLFMSRREYKVIRRRLIRGRRQAQKEGYFIGSILPFGYSKEKQGKGYVLIPNEQSKIVQLIFDKYVNENLSSQQICDYLNNLGIKSQKLDKWNTTAVRKVLRNITYTGIIQADTEKEIKLFYDGKHEPIISDELFTQAQNKLKSLSTKKKKNCPLQNPLATLCKCHYCGSTMRRIVTKKVNYPMLRCRTKDCPNMSASLYDIEIKTIEELEKKIKDFKFFIENYSDEISNKKKKINDEIELINKEINKKEKMIDKCCEMLEEGIYTKEKYLTRVNILDNDLKALKSTLNDLKQTNFDESDNIIKTIPKLELVLKEYWNLDAEQKNKILKTIINKVIYKKDTRKVRNEPDIFDVELDIKFI
ncbi:MAG: recombinase family protein [Bacilli bacterium]|nr:recombinase family protein [Bacilli bacterium]